MFLIWGLVNSEIYQASQTAKFPNSLIPKFSLKRIAL